MGCGGTKFADTALGAPLTPFTAEQCLEGTPTLSTTTLVCDTSTFKRSSTITEMVPFEGGKIIGKATVISTINKEGAMSDGAGKRIIVSKTKTTQMIPLRTQTRYLRPTPVFKGQESEFASDDKAKATPQYKFSCVVATHKMGTAEGTYSTAVAGSDEVLLLTAKRFGGIKQVTIVSDKAGNVVAKSRTTDTFGKQITIEIAAGIDKFAVGALVAALAPGGSGANAGSGTGAYGS